jgi:GGDEF domain-containing protein
MTIRDMPTGLANLRYLREALDREVSRALRYGKQLAVLTLQFETAADATHAASHDILRDVAKRLRDQAPRDWFAARAGELEVVVVAPEASSEILEHRAREWLATTARLGVAELGGALQDASGLLATARANANQSSG